MTIEKTVMMNFVVDGVELKRAKAWIEEHDRWHVEHDDFDAAVFAEAGERYIGAIGGAYTWEFTRTSIATRIEVRCACGEKKDATDYDLW